MSCKNVKFHDLCENACSKDQSNWQNKMACNLCKGEIAKPINIEFLSRMYDIYDQSGVFPKFKSDIQKSIVGIPQKMTVVIILDLLPYILLVVGIFSLLMWKKIIPITWGIGAIVALVAAKLLSVGISLYILYKSGENILDTTEDALKALGQNVNQNIVNDIICGFEQS